MGNRCLQWIDLMVGKGLGVYREVGEELKGWRFGSDLRGFLRIWLQDLGL